MASWSFLAPRYRKIARDLWVGRNRVAMMTAAIAVSLVSIGAVIATGSILGREMPANYAATNPASATLETTDVTPELLAQVRAMPGVADAAGRLTLTARVQVGERWRPMRMFVADAADPMRIAGFDLEQGAWPPATGRVLLERTVLELLPTGVGQTLTVRIGSLPPRDLTVSGLVHDASLAPAWQEGTAYAYATPETIALIGGAPSLDEVRIVVADPASGLASGNRDRIDRVSQEVAARLAWLGHPISEIRIPPPIQHPHQWQMTVVLLMLGGFSLAAVVLAAVLVSALVSAMLAEQVRQIGVLKAVGAGTRQLVGMYMILPTVVGLLAALAALAPTLLVGQGLADVVAQLLNLDLADRSVPVAVFALEVALGVGITVLSCFTPIVRASRSTVRAAIDDYGIAPDGGRVGALERRLAGMRGLGRPTLLALRNTIRRPVRTALTVGMLAFGGAIFLAGLNTIGAWNATIDGSLARRSYDVELRLAQPVQVERIEAAFDSIDGVGAVEAWGSAPTAIATPGSVDVVRTYPDGGHGSFTLVGLPDATELIDFPILEGRWLQPGDTDAIVLNHTVSSILPDARVGDSVSLDTAGAVATWRVVGIIQELGSPAMAYVSETAFSEAVGPAGAASLVRIVTAPDGSAGLTLSRIERAAVKASIPVAFSLTLDELRGAIDEHILVLMAVLVLTSVLVAVVGMLGLATTMSINVLERTREIGIMHATGARPRTVLRMVALEGIVVGLASIPLAFLLSVPVSAIVGSVVGSLSFRTPLALTISAGPIVLWLVLVVAGAAVASAVPAWNASRLPIRQALSYA